MPTKTFEYLTLALSFQVSAEGATVEFDPSDGAKSLEELGKDGWELVTINLPHGSPRYVAVFKREGGSQIGKG